MQPDTVTGLKIRDLRNRQRLAVARDLHFDTGTYEVKTVVVRASNGANREADHRSRAKTSQAPLPSSRAGFSLSELGALLPGDARGAKTIKLLLLGRVKKDHSRENFLTATENVSIFETQGKVRQLLACLMRCAYRLPPADACFFRAVSRGGAKFWPQNLEVQ